MPANRYARSTRYSVKFEDFISPMLAKPVEGPFDDEAWLFEIKWDGYRAIADKRREWRLYSRKGLSFATQFPEVLDALQGLGKSMVLDGEIIALDAEGKPSFQALQHGVPGEQRLQYQVFDILRLGRRDLSKLPLEERKAILLQETGDSGILRYSDHILGEGRALFEKISESGLEGIMAKRRDSLYYPGRRSEDWLKIHHHHLEEALIAGYTPPQGSRDHFGSLVLARYAKGGWYWAGQVGTGFTQALLRELFAQMQPLKTTRKIIQGEVPLAGITWIKPRLVASIQYSQITAEGKFRLPVYRGLRPDQSPEDLKKAQ